MRASCTVVVVVLALLAVLAMQAQAKEIYRGVATDTWSGGCADIKALSRMSWYYGWSLGPNIDLSACDLGDRYIEFVPMVWGPSYVDGFVSKIPNDTKHLLGFNEPNIPGQALMTPEEAAIQWKKVIAQLEEAGLLGKIKLGTPSASPINEPYLDPISWFKQFFSNCTGCHFDFLCFHVYESEMGGFNFWVDQFASFGLPLWVTEFAAPSPGSVQAEVDFMRQALWSLDNNTQIERYSWFSARATNVGTEPSLFNAGAGSLTAVGKLYNSKGDRLSGSSNNSDSSVASALVPHAAAELVAALSSLLLA